MSEARDGELRLRVWRGGEDGAFAAFRVPARRNQTVLDVVTWIQRHAGPISPTASPAASASAARAP